MGTDNLDHIPDTQPLGENTEKSSLRLFAKKKENEPLFPGFVPEHKIPEPHLPSSAFGSSSVASSNDAPVPMQKHMRHKKRHMMPGQFSDEGPHGSKMGHPMMSGPAPKRSRMMHPMDGQTSDVDGHHAGSSLSEEDDFTTAFVKNAVRHFNPDRVVLVVRKRGQDHTVIVNQFTKIQLGMETEGTIDDLDLYQTVRYKATADRTVKTLQIVGGVVTGKVISANRETTEGGDSFVNLVVEDGKKKSLTS